MPKWRSWFNVTSSIVRLLKVRTRVSTVAHLNTFLPTRRSTRVPRNIYALVILTFCLKQITYLDIGINLLNKMHPFAQIYRGDPLEPPNVCSFRH